MEALLESTVLAAIPVNPHDEAFVSLGTDAILDVLLNAATEEALGFKRDREMVIASDRWSCHQKKEGLRGGVVF